MALYAQVSADADVEDRDSSRMLRATLKAEVSATRTAVVMFVEGAFVLDSLCAFELESSAEYVLVMERIHLRIQCHLHVSVHMHTPTRKPMRRRYR